MSSEHTDALWLDEHHEITLTELAESCGLPAAELLELVEYGVLVPTSQPAAPLTFTGNCVVTVRTACRLRNDLDLDPHALALVLKFIDRIGELEAQLRELRAQLPRRMA